MKVRHIRTNHSKCWRASITGARGTCPGEEEGEWIHRFMANEKQRYRKIMRYAKKRPMYRSKPVASNAHQLIWYLLEPLSYGVYYCLHGSVFNTSVLNEMCEYERRSCYNIWPNTV
jgi:hypothetical protein